MPLGPPRPRPLDGVLVLDLTRLLPGDFTTWVLADLGADVVKVEDTAGGDYMRWMPPLAGHSGAMYNSINRGKRCIRLDLKQDRGRDVLLRLAARSDVLVEGFRPGTLDRLGVGFEVLSARNPGLVYCAITGYGQDGPYSQRVGHDLDYIALAGLLGVTGTSSGELAIPGFQVADMAGGGMSGALAVLAGLLARERDPERRGAFLDVSMFDGVAAILAPHLGRFLADGEAALPGRMHLNGRYPCYHLYRSRDQRWMALAALEPKFWAAFCALVERPDLLARQFEDEPAAVAAVQEVIGSRTRAEWVAATDGRDVCLEPVNDLAEAAADPHAAARGLALDGESGTQPAPLVRFPGQPAPNTHVASQGEHSDEVLGELGYSRAEVDALRSAGII